LEAVGLGRIYGMVDSTKQHPVELRERAVAG